MKSIPGSDKPRSSSWKSRGRAEQPLPPRWCSTEQHGPALDQLPMGVAWAGNHFGIIFPFPAAVPNPWGLYPGVVGAPAGAVCC